MSEYLLIGGEKDGEIVRWPRHDQAPCIFPTDEPAGRWSSMRTTPPYWPHELRAQGENDRPAYRVATPDGYLYPADHARIAYRLLALSLEDLARVRIGTPKPKTSEHRCPRCGSTRWVRASRTGGLTVFAQCVPCGAFGDRLEK